MRETNGFDPKEFFEKSVIPSMFRDPGGALQPAVQSEMMKVIRENPLSPLMQAVSYIDMGDNATYLVNKMFLGRPMLRKKVAGTDVSEAGGFLFGSPVKLDTVRMEASDFLDKQTIRRNQDKDMIQENMLTAMAQKIASDSEWEGAQGDVNTYGGGTDAVSKLLGSNDGWLLKLQRGVQKRTNGAYVSQELFKSLYRSLQSVYRREMNLKWISHPNLFMDYQSVLEERVGDAATLMLLKDLQKTLTPAGIGILPSAAWPVDLAVYTGDKTSARVRSSLPGPTFIDATHKQVKIDIDNQGAITVDLSSQLLYGTADGPLENSVIAAKINLDYAAAYGTAYNNVAFVDLNGFLVLKSPTTGATSEVDIQAVGTDCYANLGFTVAVTTGADAGSNTVPEGTQLVLTDPKNLLFGCASKNLELHIEWRSKRDGWELVYFIDTDFEVANPEAAVVAPDVRLVF